MKPIVNAVLRIAVCLAAVAGVVAVCEYAAPGRLAVPAMAFLLEVLFVSVAWGLGYGVFVSIVASLALDYFFIPPFHRFEVDNPVDFVAVIALLVTGLTASQLAERARQTTRNFAQHRAEAAVADRGTSSVLAIAAAACAVGIFVADTLTHLSIAFAVLYVVVVLTAPGFCQARGVLLVSVGCVGVTVVPPFLRVRASQNFLTHKQT